MLAFAACCLLLAAAAAAAATDARQHVRVTERRRIGDSAGDV